MTATARRVPLKVTDIAQRKVVLPTVDVSYSHDSQTNQDDPNVVVMITFNATQTFNAKGQPSDSDHDK